MNIKQLKAQLDLLPDDYEVFVAVDNISESIPVSMPMFVHPAYRKVIFG